MRYIIKLLFQFLIFSICFWSPLSRADKPISIPILVYHNFNPTVPGSMSLTPERLATQLKWIKDNGYTVIPLKQAVAYLHGENVSIPAKPVVITADDGWESVYTYMVPLVKQYHIPVTLFIYPATISSGKHAMTWAQLEELKATGLFDIQGHTYWHPNFKQEKRHLSDAAYQKFVRYQLYNSKEVLDKKLGINVTLLAWPFGIYNPYLEQAAADAGYEMAFSIDDRRAKPTDRPMAQPRYMIIDSENMQRFAGILRRG